MDANVAESRLDAPPSDAGTRSLGLLMAPLAVCFITHTLWNSRIGWIRPLIP